MILISYNLSIAAAVLRRIIDTIRYKNHGIVKAYAKSTVSTLIATFDSKTWSIGLQVRITLEKATLCKIDDKKAPP